MRPSRLLCLALLLACGLACVPPVSAQSLKIHAAVDKSVVHLNDQLVLEVSISGPHASIPEPTIPSMPSFSVYSSGRNHSISFVNGKVTSSILHNYVLVPRNIGKAVIPPVTVTVQGTTAQTSPIEIEVRPPAAAAGAGQGPTSAPRSRPAAAARSGTPGSRKSASPGARSSDAFVTAEVDQQTVFVNEQATLSVKFFTGVTLVGNPQYDPPKISGFLAEDLPPERHGSIEHEGRTYYYSEIKTALFPAQSGMLQVGPATVRAQVQQDVSIDPFAPDFFQRFFSQGFVGSENRVLGSTPFQVKVEPLPSEGKPARFSGAVGKYSISAAVDRTTPKAGEAVNLTVTVQGTGNVKALDDVKLPDMPSLRIYDTVSSMSLDKKDDLVRGAKVFKTVVVPRVSGPLTIPSIHFSYFDPSERRYVQASTLPIPLKVAEGENLPASATSGATPAGRLAAVSQDIRYLKPVRGPSAFTALLEEVGASGNAHSIPFLIFAISLSLSMVRERRAADPKGQRFRSALKEAAKRIREAEKLDPKRAASLMSEALFRYLGDKLDAAASGLTLRRAQELLRQKAPGLDRGKLDALQSMWGELDLMRFAPSALSGKRKTPSEDDRPSPDASGSDEGPEVHDRLRKLLQDLDKEIKR